VLRSIRTKFFETIIITAQLVSPSNQICSLTEQWQVVKECRRASFLVADSTLILLFSVSFYHKLQTVQTHQRLHHVIKQDEYNTKEGRGALSMGSASSSRHALYRGWANNVHSSECVHAETNGNGRKESGGTGSINENGPCEEELKEEYRERI
jgi:hypothetical protein